jgi:hypothetical protein
MSSEAWRKANPHKPKEYKAKFYKANRNRVIAESRAYRVRINEEITAYKLAIGCFYCDEREPVCLDFHHREEDSKDFTIAMAFKYGYSRDRIYAEIRKCDLVCSNCHRKIHAGVV